MQVLEVSKVTILIPHYNNPEILNPCLQSLQHLAPGTPPHDVVVVDDGSTDGSVEWVKREHPWVRVLDREENGGFVQAIQTGIQSSDGEVLVFLNNDTWVEPDWLLKLTDPFLNGTLQGAVGSILMDWEGKRALYRGVSVNYLAYGFEEQGELPDPDGPPIPVLCPCGGAMAISRSLYLETGGFDETYGMIYEDVDFGWRLNLLGYDCSLIPGSRVGHRAHTSLGRSSFEHKAKYYLLNPLRTLFKNWDDEDHLERIQMAVTLAQARERILLLGEKRRAGLLDRLGGLFSRRRSTPLVESLVQEEERSRHLARNHEVIRKKRKRYSRDLFHRFVPNPTRPWFFDEEQRTMLENAGYWELEREQYQRFGLV